MNYNTAIIPGSIESGKPAVIAEALRSLVNDNLTDEARLVFQRYKRRKPDDHELAMHYADLLLNAGELHDAERVLESELNKNPDSFGAILRVGLLDEIRGANISALDLFRRAYACASGFDEKKEVQAALERVKEKINSEVVFKPDSFLIKLKGNASPLNLQYNLPQMLRRKELFDALLEFIDPKAKSILEIECDAGTITRGMADLGFKAGGTAAEMTDITLAIGFEYVELLRSANSSVPDYFRLDIDQVSADNLAKHDVIAVLPSSLGWYRNRGTMAAASLLSTLAERSKRQLFFYIPAGENRPAEHNFVEKLLQQLQCRGDLPSAPALCFKSTAGGLLYRIDQSQADSGNVSKVLPFALAAVGSRSKVLEVAVDRCCSLNGFSFTERGWNHFIALLKELLADPGLSYEDSILKKFYDRFQPQTRQVQLFGETAQKFPPLDRGWALLPWVDTKNRRLNPVESPVLHSGGNPHHGPNSDEFGIHVCKRLLATYTLIKQHGYMPEIFPDGYVQGYLLKDGEDYRFYVNEGQHRMAVIGLLGIETIKVRFNPDFMPVVDLKNIRHWPQVRRGLYSSEVAEKVFRYYFEENGRRKAESLGLL